MVYATALMSAFWLPMQGSYNANMDEWSSEWFKVQKDLSNITINTPVGSGGGADFVGRISGQQGTDEVINARRRLQYNYERGYR